MSSLSSLPPGALSLEPYVLIVSSGLRGDPQGRPGSGAGAERGGQTGWLWSLQASPGHFFLHHRNGCCLFSLGTKAK